MHLFWKPVVEPLLGLLRPGHVIEIGCDVGRTSRHLARWCRLHGARLDLVDPAPATDMQALVAKGGAEARAHLATSLVALPGLPAADLVLIDGDHNWYTVFHELRTLWRRAEEEGRPDPVLVCHDTAWPYAYRDLYYNPATIPEEHRQPFRRGGLLPGEPGIVGNGINAPFCHAEHEGGPHNGVRRAIENALAEQPRPMRVAWLPVLNGLAVIVPEARLATTPGLEAWLAALALPRPWRALVQLAEQARLAGLATLQSLADYTETRPVPGATRSALSALPHDVLRQVQAGTLAYTYRGRPMLLNPFDLANYLALLGTLKPRTVFEIGVHQGGRTRWLADTLAGLGVPAEIIGVDLTPPESFDDPCIRLLRGNARELGEVLPAALLAGRARPFLVIEDSAHDATTSAAVLAFFDPWLQAGDRIVIEDGIAAQLALGEAAGPQPRGPALAAAEFLARRSADYLLDTEICDRFGFNATFNVNGWLIRR